MTSGYSPELVEALERLMRDPRRRNLLRFFGVFARLQLSYRTCWLRRHPLLILDMPDRGSWWVCRCGRRVGGRVY